MAKVTEVYVQLGRTVNTGVKFEFLRMDAGERITLGQGEDAKVVAHAARERLSKRVKQMIKKELENDF